MLALTVWHCPLVMRRAYAARMSFYRLKQFQCDVTGKSNMDYFQALESELQEARVMHSRFPEPLKPSILKAVQWRTFVNSAVCDASYSTKFCTALLEVMGRLDHLVEAVYERFKDRYFEDESTSATSILLCTTLIVQPGIFVDVQGEKFVHADYHVPFVFLILFSADSSPRLSRCSLPNAPSLNLQSKMASRHWHPPNLRSTAS